jgi:hypothetical protein
LENILDSALVSSDVLYASYIQDTRGIDTALPCKLVCESSAQKKTACGLSAGRHSSGAEIAALRRNEVQALQLLRVRFYMAYTRKFVIGFSRTAQKNITVHLLRLLSF